MKKISILALIILSSYFFTACKKDKVEVAPIKTFAEMFNSLPVATPPVSSDMKAEEVIPGNDQHYWILTYKGDTLGQNSKWGIQIISQDFAFCVGPYGTVWFAHKNKIFQVEAGELLLFPENATTDSGTDLRNYRIKIDATKEYAYLRAEWWTMADVERCWAGLGYIGKVIYFRYSLSEDKLVNENLQQIKL